MDLNLKGKVAIVTGTGNPLGFGRAIALTLAREGCDIVSNDIDLKTAEQAAAEVVALGQKAIAVKADVASVTEVKDMVKTTLDHFGKIDILVNNAGAPSPVQPFVEQNEADWDRCIDITLKGAMICAKAVLPDMLQRGSGKIVNISSGGAWRCDPLGEAYVAAKAGIIAFTKCLALEVITSGINVNAVAPGWAATRENIPPDLYNKLVAGLPIGRPTTSQDIANMVAFLASDVASDIVGKTYGVDGGSA